MDEKIEKKKRIKQRYIYYALGILLFLIFIWKFILAENVGSYTIAKEKLTVSKAKIDNFYDYITVTGTVEPITTLYLDAIEGGRVEEIMIDEGELVEKGDVILKLSNNELNLSILNTEAQLAEQINFLRNTRIQMEQEKIRLKQEKLTLEFDIKHKFRDFRRNKDLFENGFIAEEEFLLSKETYEQTKQLLALVKERQKQDSLFRQIQVCQMNQNLEKMKQNLELVHNRLENLNVKAVGNGQLSLLDAVIGQNIKQGQRIGQINVISSYKIVADIDEHYIDRVKTQLSASFDKQDSTYNLQIKKLYPEVINGYFEIDLTFIGNHPKKIKTGQTYQLNIELGSPKNSIIIPRGSFIQSTGGQWIYVLNEDENYAYKRKIKLGKQNPLFYEVIDGIEAGEKVITSNYDIFNKLEKIRID